jgi:hypothetical protein
MTNYKIDRSVLIAKEKLHPNPWNPNKMEDRAESALQESVSEFGQVGEILVRPHPEVNGEYQIIDGEHRFSVLPESVYCNVIYDLADSQAKKLTLIMNETRGQNDKIALSQLLNDLEADMTLEELQVGLPFELSELEDLLELGKFDWDTYGTGDEAEGEDPTTPEDSGLVKLVLTFTQEQHDEVNAEFEEAKKTTAFPKDKQRAWGEFLFNRGSSKHT